MRVFVYKPSERQTNPVRPKDCRASVWHLYGHHQCHRRGVIERKIDGKPYLFCRQHDPVAVQAKSDARQAKWDADAREREARYAREEQEGVALEACREACERIAAGHNDPRTLAREALELFPKGD